MTRRTRRFRPAERGQGAIEWIIIIAFVVILAMVAFLVFRDKVGGSMENVNKTVSGWSEGAGSSAGTGGNQVAGSGGSDGGSPSEGTVGGGSAAGGSDGSAGGSSGSEEDGGSSGSEGVEASTGGGRSSGGPARGGVSMGGLPTWFWFAVGIVLVVMAGLIAKPMFDKK